MVARHTLGWATGWAGVCWLLCIGVAGAFGEQWNRFRGPNGSGVSTVETVPVEWAEDEVHWKIALPGIGHSSPVLWNKRIFLTSADEETGTRTLLAVHADSGDILWTRDLPGAKHGKHQLNSFASSTPAVDAERIYLLWATPEEYLVQAFDHGGELLWSRDLGPFKAGHGFGVSPIVHEQLLIVPNDQGGDSSLIALDAANGEVRWQVPRETQVTYSTPCIYRPEGRKAELIFTNWKHGITAVDPDTGKTNWEISVFDQEHIETAIGSPIVIHDLVLGTAGWLGHATHTVAARPDPNQPGAGIEAYRLDKVAPLTTTPVANEKFLFLWADNGIVTCADSRTGEIHWRQRVGGTYYASPVIVGDAVYNVSADGEAVVLAASDEYRLLARNPLGEGSHSTPAVAYGRMYLRTFSHLISLGGENSSD